MTPTFTLEGYADLLNQLIELGYTLTSSDRRLPHVGKVVYLQHDIDIHPDGALDIAAIEEACGAKSCWYVATRLEYNPGSENNARILKSLAKYHAIGLHYMAGQMSIDIGADRLFIENISGARVRSQVMHRPSGGGTDYFRDDERNPFNLCDGYISDSRMQWTGGRIEKLLAGGGPDQVRLCTHHEHWLGNGRYNTTYLKMIDVVERSHRDYIIDLMEG